MSPRVVRHIIVGLDVAWIVLSAITAYMLRTSSPWNLIRLRVALHESLFMMVVACLVWLVVFHRLKLDGFYGGYEAAATMSRLFTGTVALTLLVASARFMFHQDGSRLLLASFAGMFFAAAFAGRLTARTLARRFAARGSRHRVLIVGKGQIAQELAERIQRHPEMRWELVGFLFPSAEDFVMPVLQARRSRQLNSLNIDSLLEQQAVDELVLAAPVPDKGEMLNLVANCRNRGVRVSVIPSLYQLYVNRPALVDVDGLPLLHFAEGNPSPLQSAVKRVFDLAAGFAFLLVSSPLLLLSGLLLWISRGTPVRSEPRCGRDGQPFRMYRFNARRGAGASALERLLHTLSITELPQLVNVLKGEMSLVGPRPETEQRVKRYSDWQRQRLVCRPGMTGLAQVHGLREASASEDKAYYDLRYIQDWTLLTDVALLFETLWILPRRFFPATAPLAQPREVSAAHQPGKFRELAHADRP